METRDCQTLRVSVNVTVEVSSSHVAGGAASLAILKGRRRKSMKLLIGVVVSFVVGLGCRYFDIPVPSPPVVPGAVLVLAMTIGYSSTNALLNRKGKLATTAHLCGGPTGSPAATAKGRTVASSPNGE